MVVLRRSVVKNRGHICGAHATVAGSAFPVVMFPRVTLRAGVGKCCPRTCFGTACLRWSGAKSRRPEFGPLALLAVARPVDRTLASTARGLRIALAKPEEARSTDRAFARTASGHPDPLTKPATAHATDRAPTRTASGPRPQLTKPGHVRAADGASTRTPSEPTSPEVKVPSPQPSSRATQQGVAYVTPDGSTHVELQLPSASGAPRP